MGGDGVANGDRADAAPAERGKAIDADPGGRGRRAPPLASLEPAPRFPPQRGRWRVRIGMIGLPRRCPGCVSACGCVVEASSGQASRGEVHPPAALPHGARCMWPLSSGSCVLRPTPNSIVILGTRVCLVTSTARPAFLGRREAVPPLPQEPSICCRCALRRCTWLHPPEQRSCLRGRKLLM